MPSNRVGVLVVTGFHERLQMAGMVASVAAVSGSDVTVFLSMNALQYFVRDGDRAPPAEGSFGATMASTNVPPFRQLFEQAVSLGGAKVHPCSMATDVLRLEPGDLVDWLAEPLGLTRFLADALEGTLVTF